jgi:predicted alpha/beta superfamily hydrolase
MIVIDKIKLPYQDGHRTIRLYLPDDYESSSELYPVIYMHDAQNLYDVKTSSYGAIWDVDTHLKSIKSIYKKDFIVVGIDNYEGRHNRLDEYSPWVNTRIKEDQLLESIQTDVGGLGDQYIDFLVTKLKPMIDKTYRTLKGPENTCMIGSSMGGLISLYAGLKYPHVFGMIAAFSTAVWFAEKELLQLIKAYDGQTNGLFYLDIGTKETSNDKKSEFNEIYLIGTKKVYQALAQQFSKDQLLLIIDEGGIHNEKDWSKRFKPSIKFLFKKYLNGSI